MKTLNYNVKLVESISKGVRLGTLTSNLIAPSVTLILLSNTLPNVYLFSWYFINIFIYFLRINNSNTLQEALLSKSKKRISNSLYYLFFLTALSALAYSSIVWISVIHNIAITKILLIAIIIITMTAGSISTIGSIYTAFILYISFAIIPLIGAMLYVSGELFNLISFILLIYLIVHSISAYRLFINQRDATSLQDSFKTIFTQTSDGIVLVKNNRFKDCNDSIIKMFGFNSKEEFLNYDLKKFSPIYQPDGSKSKRKMLEVLKIAWNEGNYGYQWLHTKINKEELWTDINLTRINLNGEELIYGIWRDISDRKEAEAKLEKLNNTLERRVSEQILEVTKKTELFEAIFHTAKDGIAILDLESNFLLANKAYQDMTGYDERELYQTSCINLTISNMVTRSKEVLQKVLEDGYFNDYEKICILKNGKHIEIKMNLVLMPDKKSILMISKDMTTENILKKEKQTHDKKLLQHSKLAQMGEMISMIAHQWRQPLGAISSTAVNLKIKLEFESFDLSSKDGIKEATTYFDERLSDIESFVANLTTTIDDFRNFYKPNKVAELTNIKQPILKTFKIIENSLTTDNISIVQEHSTTKEVMLFDNEVMQVLLNIFKNAQDNFRLKKVLDAKISIRSYDTTKGICLEIWDNGGGIDKDILDKIFEPYFSTKTEKNGTGLGLYMSKMIIEEHHNGNLNAKNKNGGVCFKIELPDRII